MGLLSFLFGRQSERPTRYVTSSPLASPRLVSRLHEREQPPRPESIRTREEGSAAWATLQEWADERRTYLRALLDGAEGDELRALIRQSDEFMKIYEREAAVHRQTAARWSA